MHLESVSLLSLGLCAVESIGETEYDSVSGHDSCRICHGYFLLDLVGYLVGYSPWDHRESDMTR